MDDLERRLRATGGKGQCGPLKTEAADEIKRLQQALADAHGLLISYEKAADRFEDLKHDVELHFSAFRQGGADG